jgi:hypothetical protein
VPTLAPPVFDTGGTGSATRQPSTRKPLIIVLVFVGTLVATVVALRLILGPFGGAEPADRGSTTSTDHPATTAEGTTAEGTTAGATTAGAATAGAASEPPSATVTRPADARRTPDGLVRQFLRELLTRQPGESPSQVVERLGDLLAPEAAYTLGADAAEAQRPGSLVEVGTPSVTDPDIYDVEVQPWTYGPDDAVTDAVPAGRQVWRVAVRNDRGLWSVTAAQVV